MTVAKHTGTARVPGTSDPGTWRRVRPAVAARERAASRGPGREERPPYLVPLVLVAAGRQQRLDAALLLTVRCLNERRVPVLRGGRGDGGECVW